MKKEIIMEIENREENSWLKRALTLYFKCLDVIEELPPNDEMYGFDYEYGKNPSEWNNMWYDINRASVELLEIIRKKIQN
ncbi:hypothetical protein ACFLY5_00815 [Patescibacteria group bacterium]